MQMQLSHKRARVELERAASTSARSYEVSAGGRLLRPRDTSHTGQEPRCSASGRPGLPSEACDPLCSPPCGCAGAGAAGSPLPLEGWDEDPAGSPGGVGHRLRKSPGCVGVSGPGGVLLKW